MKQMNLYMNRLKLTLAACLLGGALLLPLAAQAANYYLIEEDSQGNLREYFFELQPGLVADIVNDRWRVAVKDFRQMEGLAHDFNNIVIYKLKTETKVGTEDFLAQASPGLAPVFKAPGGNYQIIMGEVNVFFALDLAEEQVRDFFLAQGIEEFRPLSWGENGYQVKSAPGLAALELSNRLRILPQIAKVYPNFWRNGYSVQ